MKNSYWSLTPVEFFIALHSGSVSWNFKIAKVLGSIWNLNLAALMWKSLYSSSFRLWIKEGIDIDLEIIILDPLLNQWSII